MMGTGVKSPKKRNARIIIHVFNLLALLALSIILLLTAVVRPYQLVLLIPVIGLILLYSVFHTNQNVLACYFGISVALVLWIVLCENIVTIESLLGLRITSRLALGSRLYSYVATHAKAEGIQQCCNDPLSYNYKPGSVYRHTYDCDTCNPPYQIVVDETGHLNRQLGLINDNHQIDLFLAGDSVTQGFGAPGVLEFVKAHLHLNMWNLSIGGYGPRQKINALITYALPKRPKWLVVEFYSGNDISDAITDEVCDSLLCKMNITEIYQRLSVHPIYRPMLDIPRVDLSVLVIIARTISPLLLPGT